MRASRAHDVQIQAQKSSKDYDMETSPKNKRIFVESNSKAFKIGSRNRTRIHKMQAFVPKHRADQQEDSCTITIVP